MVHSKQCVARLFLHYQDWLRIADPVYHSSLHCWLSQYASCEIWGVWGWGWGEVVRRSNISINLVFKKAQSVLDCPGAIVSKFSGCQARTSPQQNWQELSKLQESVAGGRAGRGARPSTGLLRLCAPHSWSPAHFVNDYVAGHSTGCSLYNSKSVSQVLTLSPTSQIPPLSLSLSRLSQEKKHNSTFDWRNFLAF